MASLRNRNKKKELDFVRLETKICQLQLIHNTKTNLRIQISAEQFTGLGINLTGTLSN